MSELEKYNKTGMRDAYNVLKHLEKHPYESNIRKKGGEDKRELIDNEEDHLKNKLEEEN